MTEKAIKRCEWAKIDLAIIYHDTEWGVPVHEDNLHYEYIVLDGAQAGLSWDTILKKRENYRKAFDGFDPQKVARYTGRRVENLLQNPGIIRNRLKVNSAIKNAKAFLKVQEEYGSFDAYIWQFVEGETIHNKWKKLEDVPPTSTESDAMSKDMKSRGFNFVGSTICYAYMQAAGMVNDHVISCFRYKAIKKMST